jgi:hypothetical protein
MKIVERHGQRVRGLCGNGRLRNGDEKACERSGKMLGAREAIDAPPAT